MQYIMEEPEPVELATQSPKFTENITVHEVKITPTWSPNSCDSAHQTWKKYPHPKSHITE